MRSALLKQLKMKRAIGAGNSSTRSMGIETANSEKASSISLSHSRLRMGPGPEWRNCRKLSKIAGAHGDFDGMYALWYFGSGQLNANHSSVAQWQSIRLLTEGL
jgi:hypothetical protein